MLRYVCDNKIYLPLRWPKGIKQGQYMYGSISYTRKKAGRKVVSLGVNCIEYDTTSIIYKFGLQKL